MIFILQKTLIFTIPLLIVALAGMFAERSGIINIALDGIMIFGDFIGAVVTLLLRQNVPFFVDHNQIMFVVSMLGQPLQVHYYRFYYLYLRLSLKQIRQSLVQH